MISVLFVVKIISLIESVNSSACINKLLLAGIEGVALGANFNSDILLGGTSLDHIAACAGNSGLNIVRVDSLFHCKGTSLSENNMMYIAAHHIISDSSAME